ncbi:MAG: hypothetical protein HY547_03615 [Elusimicrobia bacterium]|nr:hypothetical protein [Elusimicrobiota bacterium]
MVRAGGFAVGRDITAPPSPPGPTNLRIVGGPQEDMTVGQCSASNFSIIAQNDGNATIESLPNDLTITLGDQSDGNFFSDRQCVSALNNRQITMRSGERGVKPFYYKKPTAGQVTLRATANNLREGAKNTTIIPIGPTQLTAETEANRQSTFNEDECFILWVHSRNSAGQITDAVEDIPITFDDGGADGNFYRGGACHDVRSPSQLSIPAGGNNIGIPYKKPTPGNVTLTVNAAPEYPQVTRQLTIRPVPTLLAFSVAPANIVEDSCRIYTVESRSDAGQPTNATQDADITFNDNDADGNFYSNDQCSGEATGRVRLAQGTNRVSRYYKKPTPGNLTLQVNGGGLRPVPPLNITVTAAGPTRMAIEGGPSNAISTGTCTSVMSAVLKNENNETATANSALNLTLSDGADGAFFTDRGCANRNNSRQLTVASGASSARFFYKKPTAGQVTITVRSPNLRSGTKSITVRNR